MTTTSGVLSGVSGVFDASSLVSSLVAAAKTPENAIYSKINNVQTQVSSLGSLITQVQALGTAVTALSTRSGAQAYSATTTDAGSVSASVTSSAQAGNYVMQVSQLATAQTSASSSFTTNAAGVAGTGSLTLSTAGGTSASISYDSTDSLTSIAAKINSQASGIAQASVLYDGSKYRLVVNSTNTGSAGAVQFSESSGSTLGIAGSGSTIVAAQDAKLTMNGIAITRSSNTISDVVPGVTLKLSSTTTADSPTTVTVGPDATAIASKVTDFVKAYNSLVKSVASQTTYSGSQLGEDSLFGDTAVQGLRSELGSVLSSGYTTSTGGLTSVGAAGITLNSDGTLTVDSDKLNTAVAANPQAISDLFVSTSGNGIASAVSSIVDRYAGTNGQLTTEKSQRNDSIQGLEDQITAIEKRGSDLQALLTSQFAKLDTVQQQWSSQASYLTALANKSSNA